jgi:ferredoxin
VGFPPELKKRRDGDKSMDFSRLDRALEPFEKKLRAQESFRKRLGVKEVKRPTYERYITGPVERFDRQKNAFMTAQPDNPFGEDFRRRFKARTGFNHFMDTLPYSELEVEDRIGQGLFFSAFRLCSEYHPKPLPVTPPEGRCEGQSKVWMTRLIKKAALLFGAEMVRITKIDKRWLYKDLDIPHTYAIVIVVSHKPSMIDLAPSFFSTTATGDAYSRLKLITTQLTDFIRALGYDAAFRETLGGNPEMQMVPLALDAGVGEFSRNGRVLSPEFGLNMRMKPVTTNLPLVVDKPISFRVHDFCMACENCARYCPANAIPFGPPNSKPPTLHNNPGFTKWYVRADRCLIFWGTNKRKWLSCGGRCIAVCPWNKPQNALHNAVRILAIHGPERIQRLLVLGDRTLYRRAKSIKQK